MINQFGKVAAYKTSKQNTVAFLHANNELTEEKYKRNSIHNSHKPQISANKF